ncbi:MAG TPA: PilZ domain-containing protein [Candidatus Acidoferrum sp.]|nr:PilZ domain-containing protein [Candidatus Acidoferrum sp.]
MSYTIWTAYTLGNAVRGQYCNSMVSRAYRRVRMRLPARLRWTSPLGQKIELAETKDVSRGGSLLSSGEPHAAGVTLWVTFPYDASIREGQPEVPARVVRCNESRAAPLGFFLALQFEGLARFVSNGNGARRDLERRRSPRRSLAMPIRVRPENVPWFEEAMLLDFSPRGMCFRSQREYATGELLRISSEGDSTASGAGEFRAKVVRLAPVPGAVSLDVGVCRAT